jgi:hypothetical protein
VIPTAEQPPQSPGVHDAAPDASTDHALTGDRIMVLLQLANEATAAYDLALNAQRLDARTCDVLAALRARAAQQADELNAGLRVLTRARPVVSSARTTYVEQLVTVTPGLGAKGMLVALRALESSLERAYSAAAATAFEPDVLAILQRQLADATLRSARLDALLSLAPFRSQELRYAKRPPPSSRTPRVPD